MLLFVVVKATGLWIVVVTVITVIVIVIKPLDTSDLVWISTGEEEEAKSASHITC